MHAYIASCSCQLRNEEGTEAEMCPTVTLFLILGLLLGAVGQLLAIFSCP